MRARQELFEGLPADLPETKLGELVIAYAERAAETGMEKLPITQDEVESYRNEVEALLQLSNHLVEGPKKRSKKLHRNLVAAVREILYHHPEYRNKFLLVLKEIPEQEKPWVPTHLGTVTMIRRDLLEKDPGPNVYCVIESSKKRGDTIPMKRKSLYRVKRGIFKSA